MFSSFLFQISYTEVEKKKIFRISSDWNHTNKSEHTHAHISFSSYYYCCRYFLHTTEKKLYFKTIKEGYPSQKTQQYNTTPHILIKPIFDLFNKSKCLLIDLKLEQWRFFSFSASIFSILYIISFMLKNKKLKLNSILVPSR